MGLESINLADKLAKFSDYHSMADRPRVHAIDRPRDVEALAAPRPAQRPAGEVQPRSFVHGTQLADSIAAHWRQRRSVR